MRSHGGRTYPVRRVVAVKDGDTYDLELRLGFGVSLGLRFRLTDIDTPEVYGRYASAAGVAAKRAAEVWLEDRVPFLTAHTYRANLADVALAETLGRWLVALVDDRTGEDLASHLRALGHVKEPTA